MTRTVGIDGWQPSPLALMFRPCCTECGHTDLIWCPATLLADLVAKDDPAFVRQILANGAQPDDSAWTCQCGGYGVLGGFSGGS